MDLMRRLRPFLLVTDTLFLAYWAVTSLVALKVLAVPEAWLFKDYHDARVVAWNWSFLPLDLAFALSGYGCLILHRAGRPEWRPLALISLTLTFCAGLLAVSYWALLREFDPLWFLPNLALVLWPLGFAGPLVRSLAAANRS